MLPHKLIYSADGGPRDYRTLLNFPPQFAIFSRCWDIESVQDPEPPHLFLSDIERDKLACKKAIEYDHEWLWTKSTCADHISSNDLLRCIYDIYAKASLCFVYLSDIGPHQDWKESVWFRRTDTLLELVASGNILFFRSDWTKVGSKDDLCEELSLLTNIDEKVLKDPGKVQSCSVAERMSWASHRQPPVNRHGKPINEESAYCMIGIFRVSESFVPEYGVGLKEAMLQLQHEIMEACPNDLSIFEWTHSDINDPRTNGILAGSPFQFRWCHDVEIVNVRETIEKIPRSESSDEMFSIKVHAIAQGPGQISWVLNCYHREFGSHSCTLIPLSKEPPKSPETTTVGCHRTDISKVSNIDLSFVDRKQTRTGRLYIRKDGTAFFRRGDFAANPPDVLMD
ncbi:hypothetical protein ANOM_002083 [Aspergillus nomiae NRRL 13137]|uniref:Heterokaryon incompatibility domain-containing protein n=1 Tax=Aspergillus nomiae NRRL (strain ATCC 15546 / NRRL 13137 / CBS 260.88 / M93) TaxID=1509407 RepID=A0A0L1JFF8_ASPN3|nr:uncharacterized protein ANOM_002083 [Aspergillus nomiae NRRL 13137]KNG90113.1 hypothetical protein ANOM_002083 [Aspergillus nomiae NRRL 13137]